MGREADRTRPCPPGVDAEPAFNVPTWHAYDTHVVWVGGDVSMTFTPAPCRVGDSSDFIRILRACLMMSQRRGTRQRCAPGPAGVGVPPYQCCRDVAGSDGCSSICAQFQMVPQCLHKRCPKPTSKHTPEELLRCRQNSLIPYNERETPKLYCSWCAHKAVTGALG